MYSMIISAETQIARSSEIAYLQYPGYKIEHKVIPPYLSTVVPFGLMLILLQAYCYHLPAKLIISTLKAGNAPVVPLVLHGGIMGGGDALPSGYLYARCLCHLNFYIL